MNDENDRGEQANDFNDMLRALLEYDSIFELLDVRVDIAEFHEERQEPEDFDRRDQLARRIGVHEHDFLVEQEDHND